MPIREIFNYIREQRSKLSKEEIIQQLREKGYAEEEIEEAFLFDESSVGAVPYLTKDRSEQDSRFHPTTIWEAIKQRQSAHEVKLPPKVSALDRDKIWHGALVMGGLALAPLFYYLGVLSLFFLQLFWPVPQVDPLFILGGSVFVSGIVGFSTRQKSLHFSLGAFWGTTAMFLWLLATLAVQYKEMFLIF